MCNILTGLLLLSAVSVAAATVVYTGEFACGHSNYWYAVSSDNPNRQKTRELAYDIRFPTTFREAPQVFLSVSSLDAIQDKNLRYTSRLYHVTSSGFRASCYTWWDTIIFSMKVSWIAIGNVSLQ